MSLDGPSKGDALKGTGLALSGLNTDVEGKLGNF